MRSIFGTSFFAVSSRSILIAIVSERPNVKTAIDVDDFSGAERQQILGNRRHGLCHIAWRSPTPNGRESVGNQFVVLRLHHRSHIGLDDPRPNLIDPDPMLR